MLAGTCPLCPLVETGQAKCSSSEMLQVGYEAVSQTKNHIAAGTQGIHAQWNQGIRERQLNIQITLKSSLGIGVKIRVKCSFSYTQFHPILRQG